jgi:hypothetical protein
MGEDQQKWIAKPIAHKLKRRVNPSFGGFIKGGIK